MNAFNKTLQMLVLLQESRGIKREPVTIKAVTFKPAA